MSDPEPITARPTRDIGRTVFTQTWADLTFLHWAVAPELVQPHLPIGTRADVIDGATYVGLVPFTMRGVGVLGSPGVPYFGTFLETNVRLYSVDETGRRGVVFLSLEAARLVPVVVARLGPRLPYLWSRMRCTQTGDTVRYETTRRWPGPRGTTSQVSVRVGGTLEPGPLEHFLTARWGLHLGDRRGRTRYWPNAHEQWPLRTATLEQIDDNLLAAAGFTDLADRPPDHVMYSPGVHARFGPRLR